MKKINLKLINWALLFVFAIQITLPVILPPTKVSAAESVESLKSKVKHIQKLRGLRKCIDDKLATGGIGLESGPFTLKFIAGRAVNAYDTPVGHGVDTGDGKWDCASASGDRENTWFKLILKNGSDSEYYSGWSSGGDNSYKSVASKNLAEEGGYLYFINRDNLASHSGGGKLTEGPAKGKVKDQLGRTIAVLERDLTQDEKDAMAYLNLSWTFADSNACKAQEVDANSGGKKVKIGNKLFRVGNPGGKNSVGFGFYGDNGQGIGDGNLTCEQIADRMASLASSYEKATGDTSTIPEGSNRAVEADGDTEGDIEAQCDITPNPITWIMCALITGFIEAINALDEGVTNLLNIRAAEFFGEGQVGDSFNSVWVSVRTIALGFLIIVALVMIISTAIGVGPFDAYTVKKVMPRLVAVIILIPLSWSIVYFMIDMTSVIGFGVRNLIQAPFAANIEGIGFGSTVSTTAATGLLVGGLFLGLPGLLSFLVGGFLAVLIAYVVLVLRQIFIILLAVLAPVALVAAILPNTQKAWKFWWESFWKALIVFPIIAAFIAAGRIFAQVAETTQGGGVGDLIAFVAYFAPYFLIPQAFKMAGGLLGNLTGAVNDRGRGAFDRLRKFRQGQMQQNMQKIDEGSRFSDRTKLGSKVNSGLRKTSKLNEAGFRPSKMRSNINSAISAQDLRLADEKGEKDDAVRAIINDDDMLDSFKFDDTDDQIRQRLLDSGRFGEAGSKELNAAVATVRRAKRTANSSVRSQIAAVGSTATGTGIKTHADMYQAAIDASDGNPSTRNAVFAKMRAAAERAGNYSLSGPGHAESVDAMESMARGESASSINARMLARSMEVQGAGKILQGKPTDVENLTAQLATDYQSAMADGDLDKATSLAAQMKSLRDADNGASPENTKHVNAMLAASEIDEGMVNPETGAPLSIDEQFARKISGRMGSSLTTEVKDKYATELAAEHQRRVNSENIVRARSGQPQLTGAESLAKFDKLVDETALNVINQRIRTRAGSYDVGGGNRNVPEELRRQQALSQDDN